MSKVCYNNKKNPRIKYIALPYHFFQTKVEELDIVVIGCSIHDLLDDQFTKVLIVELFVKARKRGIGW